MVSNHRAKAKVFSIACKSLHCFSPWCGPLPENSSLEEEGFTSAFGSGDALHCGMEGIVAGMGGSQPHQWPQSRHAERRVSASTHVMLSFYSVRCPCPREVTTGFLGGSSPPQLTQYRISLWTHLEVYLLGGPRSYQVDNQYELVQIPHDLPTLSSSFYPQLFSCPPALPSITDTLCLYPTHTSYPLLPSYSSLCQGCRCPSLSQASVPNFFEVFIPISFAVATNIFSFL